MWLLAGVAFAAMLGTIIVHTFNYKRDYYIPVKQVTETEEAFTQKLEAHA
jgi:cytochrome o ubiquinol oxidase subunit 1